MMRRTVKMLLGTLFVGTVFAGCQKPGEKQDVLKNTELRRPAEAELKPAPEKTVVTPWVVITGALKYKVIKAAEDTAKKACLGDAVSVHYTGWLDKGGDEPGVEFDSSVKRAQPFVFTLGQRRVIAGWEKGVVGMRVGEKRRLSIPAVFAYGKEGIPGVIPQDATLIFDVELLGVN